MTGNILKAVNLGILGQQAEERVEHDINHRVFTHHIHRAEIAYGYGNALAIGFGAQPVDHGLGGVDAMHFHAHTQQRQSKPPRADA